MTQVRVFLVALVVAIPAVRIQAADAPSWPYYQGPNGNFSATDCGLTLVDDLKDARLVWKSQEPTPPGAAQSPRYGGHGWHGISLRDFRPIQIPLAAGGAVTSGGGVLLPGGGASSPLVANSKRSRRRGWPRRRRSAAATAATATAARSLPACWSARTSRAG